MREGHLALERVCKRFRRGVAHDTLGELIVGGLRRLSRSKVNPREADAFWALHDVSFAVRSGEAVGLIGPNGAGKSTALKLIAGIMRPDTGQIATRGRLTALIEIGAGFHGDLTGRENIHMNASILGMRNDEIARKLDAIVDFSGIAEFIDTPVKRYSSGMQARLGFSVAAHVDPDVLLVDEVLSVGDVVFRQRCIERMRELVAGGTSLLFVTHHLEQMQSFCSRAIVLDRGGVTFDGPSYSAVAHYLSALRDGDAVVALTNQNGLARVADVCFADADSRRALVMDAGRPMAVVASVHLAKPVARLVVEIDIRKEIGSLLANFSSVRDEITFDLPAGDHSVTLSMPSLPLAGGQYLCRCVLRDADGGRTIADSGFRYHLAVKDHARATGILCIPHEWEVQAPHVAHRPTDQPTLQTAASG